MEGRTHPGNAPKLSDKQCAHLIATTCTPAPEGQAHWTLRRLADRVVQLGYAETFSYETVRRRLKNTLKPWPVQEGCIAKAGAEFVAAREEVLDVHEAPYDPAHPVVCFDESPKQLIGEVRTPLPPRPGTPARQDTEYKRPGGRKLMRICAPKRGGREVQVMERRTPHRVCPV